MRIGAHEAGGTKMVCAIGNEQGDILERIVVPTRTPDDTIPDILSFFKRNAIEALGIGCFGPLNLDLRSNEYGTITSTPKEAWRQFQIVQVFYDSLKVPVALDTDVNAAVLGEATWGAGIGDEVLLYITIGTGVGVGVLVNNQLMHGLVHPEAGHMYLSRRKEDLFRGTCPYHRDCLEGLVSGPAIEGRWGQKAEELSQNALVWELEADYIAQALSNFILAYSPNRIILGGGVMRQQKLYPMIREKVIEKLNGYIRHRSLNEEIDAYIVAPGLGENSGIKGAIKLAINKMQKG